MTVQFSGPIADLELVWLQCQAPTCKPGIGVSHPVQPLQSTLVSPYSKRPPEKVHSECFNAQPDCQTVAYFSSRGKSFLLKKATGRSSPASSTWVSTAPTPLSEASVSNTNGRLMSGLLSRWFETSIAFGFLKAVSHSSDHLTFTGYSLRVKSVMGAAIEANSGINLR